MSSALEVHDITKVYGDRTVVDNVSFQVDEGEIFGLLGPNGSGKTTIIRMALDIIRPDSGRVALLGGMSTRDALAKVGYLPEERGLYQRSRVMDILTYLGRLKRLDSRTSSQRAEELLQQVGLHDQRHMKVQAMSRGMSQLVQFAGALIHDPDLIIFDEPFSGLDPINVLLMKDMIREQQQRGATVIFSTHQMVDVEEMCQRVLLINEGQRLLYGALDDLKRSRGTHNVKVTAENCPTSVPGASLVNNSNGHYEYQIGGDSGPETVIRSFLDAEIPVERYEVALPSLNDIFIEEVSRARSAR